MGSCGNQFRSNSITNAQGLFSSVQPLTSALDSSTTAVEVLPSEVRERICQIIRDALDLIDDDDFLSDLEDEGDDDQQQGEEERKGEEKKKNQDKNPSARRTSAGQ